MIRIATYNKLIKIQKLVIDREIWEDVFLSNKAKENNNPYIHASINKSSGKEYFNARTDISASTFNFNIRYCSALEELLFNTQLYRIIYKNKVFDIKNADNPHLNNHDLIIVGEFNGKEYFD